MTDPDRPTEIEARLVAATPGPWFRSPATTVRLDGTVTVRTREGNRPVARIHSVDRTELWPDPDAQTQVDAEFIAHAPADIDWLVGEVERLREEREAIFRRSNAVFESKDQQIKEWRQAAGAEANLADERGRRLHDRDHALELCREEVARLRDGIKAALDCHTETARRVTLQELLEPRNANEAPQP